MEFTLEQYQQFVDETFPNNYERSISEIDLREGLKALAQFVFDTNSSTFIGESIEQVNELKLDILNTAADNEARKTAIEALYALVVNEKAATELLKNQAQTLLDNAILADNPLGDWNPANASELTETPVEGPDGSYFVATATASAPFSGSNFTQGVTVIQSGARLVKKNATEYYLIQPSDAAYTKASALENKVAKVQTLGFYSLAATSASGNVLNKVCLNQRVFAEMGGPVTRIRAKTTFAGTANFLILRKNAAGTNYVEVSRTLVNFPVAGNNDIDISTSNVKIQRGDTYALQYSGAGVEFKTNTTAGSGRGVVTVIIGGAVSIATASVEGVAGNDTCIVMEIVVDGNLAQQVDFDISALNTKITENKTSADSQINALSLITNMVKNRFTAFATNGFYQADGTFNSSISFGNSTIAITAGKGLTYSLNSTTAGVGVRMINFFDAANALTGYVQATSIGINSGAVVSPANTVKAIICNLRTGGENSYYETLDEISPVISKINTDLAMKQVRESALTVLKVSKTLAADGVTIFSTVAAALAAWKNTNVIHIYDGVYEEYGLSFPDGVIIKGIGIVEIRGFLPNTATTADVDAKSTIDWLNNGKIENLIITARNMRYPVHSDFGAPNAIQQVINCRIIHYGNADIYAYRLGSGAASPNAAADVWRATSAWGCGTQAGSKIYLKNTYLESPGRALSTHNNANYNLTGGASLLQADDCEFVSFGIDRDGSAMAFTPAIFVQSLGSKTFDKVIINNTKVNGHLVLQSSTADWREFTQDVSGSGITSHLMQVRNVAGGSKLMTDETTKQTAFVIRVKSASASPVSVSGNLVQTIFGRYFALTGSDGLNSYIKGRVYHGDVWPAVNAFADAKTITFTSGSDTKTLTLSAAYTSATQLVADMNAQFGPGSFVAELYWPGFDWYPKFTNEVDNFRNTGATAILRGRAVKSVGFRKIALMTSSDPQNAFVGIALQDIPVNASGDVKVKGYMLRIWADGLFGTALADNDLIKVNADGTFSKSADGTGTIVSKCVANENISINL